MLIIDVKKIIKIAWAHKIRGIFLGGLIALLAMVVHMSQPIKYGASMEVYMIQNYSCTRTEMVQWINSPEIQAAIPTSEKNDPKCNAALQKALTSKTFSVYPQPCGVRVEIYEESQEAAMDSLETLKYHLMACADMKNNILVDIMAEKSISMDKGLIGLYFKFGEVKPLQPILRGSIIPVALAGIIVTLFSVFAWAFWEYMRNK